MGDRSRFGGYAVVSRESKVDAAEEEGDDAAAAAKAAAGGSEEGSPGAGSTAGGVETTMEVSSAGGLAIASPRDSIAEESALLTTANPSEATKDGAEPTIYDDQAAAPAGRWRWAMSVMACTMWLVCYADRTNISLAIVEMEEEFGWSESVDGVVLSSFFFVSRRPLTPPSLPTHCQPSRLSRPT